MSDYTNASQQRLLRLIDLLSGHEVNGLELIGIAKALGQSPSAVTRDLDNLRTAGWAERHPNGRTWRLTPHVIQISQRYLTALQAGAAQLQGVSQRYGGPVSLGDFSIHS